MTHQLQHHLPVLLFVLAAIWATAFSVDYRQSIQVQLPLMSGLFLYIGILAFSGTQNRLRFLLLLSAVAAFFTVLILMPELMTTRISDPVARLKMLASVLFVVPNDVLVLSVVAPLVLGAVWTSGWCLRALAVSYFLLSLVIGVNMQSRQAVVLLLFGLAIVVAVMRPRWVIPVLLTGCLAGIVIDGLLGWPLVQKIFLFPRTYVWHAAWTMFADRPLTGQGPGLFKDVYFTFLRKAGYLIEELPDRRTMPWAHSLYLEQLGERGIFGFLALAGLLATSICRSGKSCRQGSCESTRGMAAGVFAALIVFAIAGIAETSLARIWVAVFLLVLAAFSVVISELCSHGTAGPTSD